MRAPERPGEAVWEREGGGGGAAGFAASGPACKLVRSTSRYVSKMVGSLTFLFTQRLRSLS